MKPKNTGTILDNYPTWKAFIDDAAITPSQLTELLSGPVYYKGTARAVSRHVNFNRSVYTCLKDSKHSFLKSLAYFNRAMTQAEVVDIGLDILRDTTSSPSLKHRALREVYHSIGDGSVDTRSFIQEIFKLPEDKYCSKLKSAVVCDAYEIMEEIFDILKITD